MNIYFYFEHRVEELKETKNIRIQMFHKIFLFEIFSETASAHTATESHINEGAIFSAPAWQTSY